MTHVEDDGANDAREGHLSAEDYATARRLLPVPCIDVLPRHADGRCLLIRRLDRHGRQGWNVVGGRIRVGETPGGAIERHLRETLGPEVSWDEVDWQRPHLVVEYVHADHADVPFDPEKQAIALTYVISIAGVPQPGGEALGFEWFAPDSLPEREEWGFNQRPVVERLLSALEA